MNHLAKVPDNLDSQNMCCCLMSFLHTFVDLFAEQQKKNNQLICPESFSTNFNQIYCWMMPLTNTTNRLSRN